MASPFKGVIKRQVKVIGVEMPVQISLSDTGIEMAIKGFKTKLFASWDHIAKAMLTPMNAPAWLDGKPLEFLRQQTLKLQKKEEKVYRASSV